MERTKGWVQKTCCVFCLRPVCASNENKSVEVVLKPLSWSTSEPVGQVDVHCPVPDVRIAVDDREVARTPLATPLLLTLGEHTISFMREGYVANQQSIAVTSDPVAPVKCCVKPLSPLPAAVTARLSVAVNEQDVSIAVDGAALPDDGHLPSGKHRLEVHRIGFETFEGELTLEAKNVRTVDIQLIPKAEYLSEYLSEAHTIRTLAFVIGAVGVVVSGVSVALYVWNDGRYDEWNDERISINNEIFADLDALDELDRRRSKNDELLDSIQTVDGVIVGTSIAGGTLLITGAVLFFIGEDPYKYEKLAVLPGREGGSVGFKTVW